jgi:FkbM family methyltransferase
MQKVNFHNKESNFFIISSFVKQNKLDDFEILKQGVEQGALKDDNVDLLNKFISFFQKKILIKSQLYQDIFAEFIMQGENEKTFFEFGATDGFELSNSYTLENEYKWTGALSEPSPQWHQALKQNRPKTKIITDCVWSESEKELNFFISDVGVLSSLEEFKENDKISMPGNTKARIKAGKTIKVKTISLNDVIIKYFDSVCPSYLSIDTEGSEFQILKNFNFEKHRPKVLTIEHNFTDIQTKIDELMFSNNYIRVFKKLTSFDAWYVAAEKFNEI